MREIIRRYLTDHHLINFVGDIDDDTDLFREGLLDSFGYMELIVYLERQLCVHFEVAEILGAMAVSVNGICKFIEAKQEATL